MIKEAGLSIIFIVLLQLYGCAQNKEMNPQHSNKMSSEKELEIITLGAGCFWCVEAVFQQLKGVYSVESGYSGGPIKNPTYKEVCTGSTGHAEVCQISYDPSVITFTEILEVFWKIHDPTTLNRQGGDIGTQYRSVIFYHHEGQRQVAIEMKDKINAAGIWSDPVITEITAYKAFYKAEAYHQEYYFQNTSQPYCSMVITPKLDKFKKVFADKLKEK